MTGKERITAILNHQPVDRIGLYEHFWPETFKRWIAEGHFKEDEAQEDVFGFDIVNAWVFNTIADIDFKPVTLEETAETILVKDGNGATLRRHKLHSTTPEHVAYDVIDFAGYREKTRPFILDTSLDDRRINYDGYVSQRKIATDRNLFFNWAGVNVFECMHSLCGHENLLVGMALEPEWVAEMANDYAALQIRLFEKLFARHGLPDGIWIFEDFGFKERPFMSPAMFRELIMPAQAKTIKYCHDLGLKVMMHSCGFVEPLLPCMVEAGIDVLQAMEVKAGMDPLRIRKNFPSLVLFGGLDVRPLLLNDLDAVRRELEAKVPILKQGGFILHSDHSIPDTVNYETYRFFIDEGLRLGTF